MKSMLYTAQSSQTLTASNKAPSTVNLQFPSYKSISDDLSIRLMYIRVIIAHSARSCIIDVMSDPLLSFNVP